MSKPYIHAQSSAKTYGGTPEDYLDIHNWFDETKSQMADQRHRALRHHAEGIFLCERIFGVTRVNSANRTYSVRDIGEQHVLQDFNGRFIPSAQDYLMEMNIQDWMCNGKGSPPSFAKIMEHRRRKVAASKPAPVTAGDVVFDGNRVPAVRDMILDGRRPNHLVD